MATGGPRNPSPFGAAHIPNYLSERYQKVWNRLTDTERSYFKTNPATGIGDIHKLIGEMQNDSRLRNLQRLQPYVDGLDRYHKAIAVFVQCRPEILSLIWGPVKFLLHVAKNCYELFDQILDVFNAIGKAIPQFDAMQQSFPDDEQLLTYRLTFYAEILDFHLASLRVWRRSGLRILYEAAWPRYDDTFQKTLQKISVHKDALDRHFQLLGTQANLLYHVEQRDAGIMDLLEQHLDPRCHGTQNLLERVQATLGDFPGTGQWIFSHEGFLNWIDSSKTELPERFLWLVGIPGAGKTHLCVSIVNSIGRRTLDGSGCLLYVFIKHDSEAYNTTRAILRSLILQLSAWDKALATVSIDSYDLKSRYRNRIQSHTISDEDVLRKLIGLMGGETCYILVDGLDECGEKERCLFLKALVRLAKDCPSLYVIVASLKETDLIEILAEVTTEISADTHNGKDIECYTSLRLESLRKRIRQAVFDDREANEFVRKARQKIVLESRGLFLFVQLVIDNLECQSTAEEFREELMNMPSRDHLNQIYGRIWSRIQARTPEQRDHIVRILAWLVCSKRPLEKVEIEKAVMIRPGDEYLHKDRNLPASEILRLCGCILKIDHYISLVHFSAKKYIRRQELTGRTLSLANAPTVVASSCLTYFNSNVFDDSSAREGHKLDDAFIHSGAFALHDYVSTYWFHHVRQCVKSPECDPTKAIEDLRSFLIGRWKTSFPPSKEAQIRPPPEIEELQSRISELELSKLTHIAEFEWARLNEGIADNSHASPLTIYPTARRLHNRFDEVVTENCNPNCNEYTSCSALHQVYGDRLFRCSIPSCRVAYRNQRARDNHVRRHRSFKCRFAQCDFSILGFETVNELVQHSNATHSPKEPEEAAQCDWAGLSKSMRHRLLSTAVRSGEVCLARSLLDLESANELLKEADHRLFLAAESGSLTMFNLVLSKSYPTGSEITQQKRQSLFRHAIDHGGVDVARHLLDQGADINSLNGLAGTTALHSAASRGVDTVKLLLEYGADISICCSQRKTALHYAVEDGRNVEVVRLLLERGAMIEARAGRLLMTPLHLAVMNEYGSDIVSVLIELGANVREFTKYNRDSRLGGTQPLHIAAGGCKTIETVRHLLDGGADIESPAANGQTALHYVVRFGRPLIAIFLLDRGARVEATDPSGRTPLHHSVARQKDRIEVVRLLLDKGSNIHALDDSGMTVLHHAAQNKASANIVRLLIKRGAQVDAARADGVTPLRYAVRLNAVQAVRVLLENGASVHQTSGDSGETMLVDAVGHYHAGVDVVKLLLDAGLEATLKEKDKNGGTILHYAIKHETGADVVSLLLARGSEVNAKTDSGTYPLHAACDTYIASKGDAERLAKCVPTLLNHGADINAKDNFGRTPLRLLSARKVKSEKMNPHFAQALKTLVQHGADPEIRDNEGDTPLKVLPYLETVARELKDQI